MAAVSAAADLQMGFKLAQTEILSTMFLLIFFCAGRRGRWCGRRPGPAYARDEAGTSFAAPKVARIAARLQGLLPDEPALLYRALVVQSARWPASAEALLTELRDPASKNDPERRQELILGVSQIIRCIGYGVPDETRATINSDHRTTYITGGETPIRVRKCHIYQIPIPAALRSQADDFDIRIEATLSL